ncbi:MAG: tRNA (adenosine(37)-N6)-threonylcarbamoyltransferase complex dimerization subunit type 1 TsaB [Gammaproteobacteria bacterium]|nr:tRNA (adenosine(37)-N6)-threonylcarbamoyltransferase complex dimerization subunit type 1 TsaB [Gammaproteobacteria bacterium]
MLKILAIETSTDACSAALMLGDAISSSFALAPKEHSKLILPMINSLLLAANLQLKDMNAIAFGSGPGSFTGVRLAASLVQGLAYGVNLPVIKVSSLRVLAQGAWEKHAVNKAFVVQDARVNEVYTAQYALDADGLMQVVAPDSLQKPEELLLPEQLDTWHKIGTGWEIYHNILQRRCTLEKIISYNYPEAQFVTKLAAEDYRAGKLINPEEALPCYLRDAIAWKKHNLKGSDQQ